MYDQGLPVYFLKHNVLCTHQRLKRQSKSISMELSQSVYLPAGVSGGK